MNSTSFTSIASACGANNDKMANIDSSSTAHLTLNAVNRPLTSSTKSTRVRNDSDLSSSDPDKSPSVTVITSSINNNNNNLHHLHLHHHNHLHNPLARPAQLITGGFSLSNRLHLTKHQRTLWSRATSLEKLLMLVVIILSTTTVLLFISLVSVFMSQKQQLSEQSNSNKQQMDDTSGAHEILVHQNNQNKSYCLTPDCVKVAASVIEAIDLTVDPCDDFYVSTFLKTKQTILLRDICFCLLSKQLF